MVWPHPTLYKLGGIRGVISNRLPEKTRVGVLLVVCESDPSLPQSDAAEGHRGVLVEYTTYPPPSPEGGVESEGISPR